MNAEQRVEAPRRRTRAEIEQLVAEFESSGMEHSEFCRTWGLCRSTFYRHVKKHRRKDNALVPSSQLLAVELAGMSRTEQSKNDGLTGMRPTIRSEGRGSFMRDAGRMQNDTFLRRCS
jgi:transposase-like protein